MPCNGVTSLDRLLTHIVRIIIERGSPSQRGAGRHSSKKTKRGLRIGGKRYSQTSMRDKRSSVKNLANIVGR